MAPHESDVLQVGGHRGADLPLPHFLPYVRLATCRTHVLHVAAREPDDRALVYVGVQGLLFGGVRLGTHSIHQPSPLVGLEPGIVLGRRPRGRRAKGSRRLIVPQSWPASAGPMGRPFPTPLDRMLTSGTPWMDRNAAKRREEPTGQVAGRESAVRRTLQATERSRQNQRPPLAAPARFRDSRTDVFAARFQADHRTIKRTAR